MVFTLAIIVKRQIGNRHLYIMCCLGDSTFCCGIWGMGRKERDMRDSAWQLNFISFFTFLSSAGCPSLPIAEENQGWAGPLWSKNDQHTVEKRRITI